MPWGERDLLGVAVPAWVIAGLLLGFLLALSGSYGFHRDELYFVIGGRHPDWGYADMPALTPILSAISVAILGLSPFAVRVLPAVEAAVVVLLAADMARRLGAGRVGQVLAALVLAVSGWIAAGHLGVTTTLDVLFWTAALRLLVDLLDDHLTPESRHRRWLALGLVVGIALENKTLILALPVIVTAALVVLRRRDVLLDRWFWLAAAITLVLWLPNLAWQVLHGLPQVTMAQGIAAAEPPGLVGQAQTIFRLAGVAGPLLWPVSLVGLGWLLRARAARPWRPLGLAAVILLAVVLIANSKAYYTLGVLPLAIAAGCVPLEAWLSRGKVRLRRIGFVAVTAASAVTIAVITLPLVPPALLHLTPIPALDADQMWQLGWPELVDQVGAVTASLPPAERSSAVIVTDDYGEYAALALLGNGLPPVYSGHNSTWGWGRPPDGAGPVILVGRHPADVAARFAGCRQAATIDNGLDVPTLDQGLPIFVCDGPTESWNATWPALRHVDLGH